MKKIIFIILIALLAFVDIVFATVTTTTVDKNNIPVATLFYMPVGNRDANIQSELVIADFNNHDTKTFPGFNGVDYGGWYVATDFNTNRIYDGTCYDGSEPSCGDYHTGEDWNGSGGGDSDEGQPIYSIGAGVVIAKGYGFGNMALILHRLNNDELVMSLYAHMQYETSLELGDQVTTSTQVGLVGKSGTDVAHLHFEIRKENMLDVSGDNVTVSSSYSATYWPGTDTSFIASHYHEPTSFIKSHSDCVGYYFDGFHTDGISQAFVDSYNEAGGESVLGIPWDNGGTIFVHNFPDENSNDAILIQDLLFTDSLNNVFWNLLVYNEDLEEVFPLTGQILDFWWENSGYNTYGPPTEAAHSETDVNNNAIIVQGFQSGMCRP